MDPILRAQMKETAQADVDAGDKAVDEEEREGARKGVSLQPIVCIANQLDCRLPEHASRNRQLRRMRVTKLHSTHKLELLRPHPN